ncbi:MAG: hypothetical protein FWE15_04670 [Actinomycetia bacterium]|nr:hypothetical protein [Actinomycetes bacterium]
MTLDRYALDDLRRRAEAWALFGDEDAFTRGNAHDVLDLVAEVRRYRDAAQRITRRRNGGGTTEPDTGGNGTCQT